MGDRLQKMGMSTQLYTELNAMYLKAKLMPLGYKAYFKACIRVASRFKMWAWHPRIEISRLTIVSHEAKKKRSNVTTE